jgi:hypothetical protein
LLIRAAWAIRGAARFNYGSTVIILLPPGVAKLESGLQAESAVRLGQALARLSGEKKA